MVDSWLAQRQALGHDRHDEVWNGDYYVAPDAPSWHGRTAMEVMLALHEPSRRARLRPCAEFNLGDGIVNFRVPDGGWFRANAPDALFVSTAVVVLEVLSPYDDTYKKLPFYAEHRVSEILIAEPLERWVECWSLQQDGTYRRGGRSTVFDVSMEEIIAVIRWP